MSFQSLVDFSNFLLPSLKVVFTNIDKLLPKLDWVSIRRMYILCSDFYMLQSFAVNVIHNADWYLNIFLHKICLCICIIQTYILLCSASWRRFVDIFLDQVYKNYQALTLCLCGLTFVLICLPPLYSKWPCFLVWKT